MGIVSYAEKRLSLVLLYKFQNIVPALDTWNVFQKKIHVLDASVLTGHRQGPVPCGLAAVAGVTTAAPG